jgi:hypothetical protein
MYAWDGVGVLQSCWAAIELANVMNDCLGQSVHRQQYIMLILALSCLCHDHPRQPMEPLVQALVGSWKYPTMSHVSAISCI